METLSLTLIRGQMVGEKQHRFSLTACLGRGLRSPPDLLLGLFWGWGQESVLSEVLKLFESHHPSCSIRISGLEWWFSKWGSQASSSSVTWEIVRNTSDM